MTYETLMMTCAVLAAGVLLSACGDRGSTQGSGDHKELRATGSPEKEEPRMDADERGSRSPAADFKVRFTTSKGDFVVLVHPSWAPLGAARFRELVETKHFDDCYFFRVVPGFVVQWGLSGDPKANQAWRAKPLDVDPVRGSNRRGTLSYGMQSGNLRSRSSEVFINLRDNANLDGMGFAPFGEVVEGMAVVESLHSYGDILTDPRGRQHFMDFFQNGNAALLKHFPKLDRITAATVLN